MKNGLNYPLCRGCVSSRCVVFAAVMFTFISTCLKMCHNLSPCPPPPTSTPPLHSSSLSTLDIRSTPYVQTDAIKQRKCFVCLPLAKPRAQSRLYLSVTRTSSGIDRPKRWHARRSPLLLEGVTWPKL